MTCHRGDKQARTWTFQRKCIGAHHLKSHAAENKAGPVMVCIQYFLFSLWKHIPDWTSLEFHDKIIVSDMWLKSLRIAVVSSKGDSEWMKLIHGQLIIRKGIKINQ